ncbi:ribonuclease H-like domain-containing protein [Tanacetum coccineum]
METKVMAIEESKDLTSVSLDELIENLKVWDQQVLSRAYAFENYDLEDMEPWKSTNVIENGDSWVSVPQTSLENGITVTKMSTPATAEEKTNKKNDVKARFGGNAATKKTQKTLLKQQYKNFSATIVGMNKPEFETMSKNDLYNNFKIVEQNVNKIVGTSSGGQNMAFITAPSTNSANEANTTCPQVSAASPSVNTASSQVCTASVSDNTVYAFMVENLNGSNVLHQDLEQIHEDDLEAMDLKWQLSLLSVRAKKYYQRTGKNIFINANDIVGYDKSKVECYKSHKLGHFAREGLGYSAVPPPHPLIYNRPNKLDLSYSGLDEFKEPEFKGYGPENKQGFTDKSSFVESSPNVDKETIFPANKKVEFTKPKNHEKPVKKSVREKGIKREYSIARTPQQNGVAERRNRTLIENRVLVVKPHNKTPYELFRGFKPTLSFMRPFGCHVTILNTLDNLGKFNGKSDEENKPMIEGNGPKWLFDIDSLTQSMNYVPVTAGIISNDSAGTSHTSYFDSPSKDVDNGEPKTADLSLKAC